MVVAISLKVSIESSAVVDTRRRLQTQDQKHEVESAFFSQHHLNLIYAGEDRQTARLLEDRQTKNCADAEVSSLFTSCTTSSSSSSLVLVFTLDLAHPIPLPLCLFIRLLVTLSLHLLRLATPPPNLTQ